MKKILTNAEYNVLNDIASQTKMDCWFWLDTDENGCDCVIDLEKNITLTLQQGVEMLNEGIVPELLNLDDYGIEVYVNLLNELDIANNPFEEHIQVMTEVYEGNANGICTEEELK